MSAQQNLPDLQDTPETDTFYPHFGELTAEKIADIRDRCERYLLNPRAKNWGKPKNVALDAAEQIPKLLDEIVRLRAEVADYKRRGLIPGLTENCIRGICYHPECMMRRECQSGGGMSISGGSFAPAAQLGNVKNG